MAKRCVLITKPTLRYKPIDTLLHSNICQFESFAKGLRKLVFWFHQQFSIWCRQHLEQQLVLLPSQSSFLSDQCPYFAIVLSRTSPIILPSIAIHQSFADSMKLHGWAWISSSPLTDFICSSLSKIWILCCTGYGINFLFPGMREFVPFFYSFFQKSIEIPP